MLSFGVHAGALAVAGWFALNALTDEARHAEIARTMSLAPSIEIEVEGGFVDSRALVETHAPDEPAPAPRGGGEAPPRPDTPATQAAAGPTRRACRR